MSDWNEKIAEHAENNCNVYNAMLESAFFKQMLSKLSDEEQEMLKETMRTAAAIYQPMVDQYVDVISNQDDAKKLVGKIINIEESDG